MTYRSLERGAGKGSNSGKQGGDDNELHVDCELKTERQRNQRRIKNENMETRRGETIKPKEGKTDTRVKNPKLRHLYLSSCTVRPFFKFYDHETPTSQLHRSIFPYTLFLQEATCRQGVLVMILCRRLQQQHGWLHFHTP